MSASRIAAQLPPPEVAEEAMTVVMVLARWFQVKYEVLRVAINRLDV
jgi:hypothetical protein